MSYLLIVWTLFSYTTTIIPLIQDFIVKGKDSHIGTATSWLLEHIPGSNPNPSAPDPLTHWNSDRLVPALETVLEKRRDQQRSGACPPCPSISTTDEETVN